MHPLHLLPHKESPFCPRQCRTGRSDFGFFQQQGGVDDGDHVCWEPLQNCNKTEHEKQKGRPKLQIHYNPV